MGEGGSKIGALEGCTSDRDYRVFGSVYKDQKGTL